MTAFFTILLKLLFAAILLVATIISTVIITPFMLACWAFGLRKPQ